MDRDHAFALLGRYVLHRHVFEGTLILREEALPEEVLPGGRTVQPRALWTIHQTPYLPHQSTDNINTSVIAYVLVRGGTIGFVTL